MNELDIANNALMEFWNQNPLTSLDDIGDNSQKRIACDTQMQWSIDKTLAEHTWACVTDRVILSPDSQKPAFEYQYRFQLPPDILRVWQWFIVDYNSSNNNAYVYDYTTGQPVGTSVPLNIQVTPIKDGFRVEGQYVLSNYQNLALMYIKKIDRANISVIRPWLSYLVSVQLACRTGSFLGKSTEDVMEVRKLYEMELRKCKSINNTESPHRTFAGSTWVKAHYQAEQPQLYPNIQ